MWKLLTPANNDVLVKEILRLEDSSDFMGEKKVHKIKQSGGSKYISTTKFK